MRTSLFLDGTRHTALRHIAVDRKTTVSGFINAIIEKELLKPEYAGYFRSQTTENVTNGTNHGSTEND